MTKARSKTARRKAKAARPITLPGGETAKPMPTQGCRVAEPPADLVALRYRARLTGCTVEDARDILASDDMGRCIRHLHRDNEARRQLLNVWQAVSAAWANYVTRCLSMTPSPQAAAIPMLPEAMQTDQSLRVDLRTGDERDRAARRQWDEWCGAFNRLPMEQALIIADASRGQGPGLWDADALRPTRHGANAVAALAALHNMRG
jgi:hypothetical protein